MYKTLKIVRRSFLMRKTLADKLKELAEKLSKKAEEIRAKTQNKNEGDN